MTQPTDHDHARRQALRDALVMFRHGFENEPPAWWFAELVADLGHLWHEHHPTTDAERDADPIGGFTDAVAAGMRILYGERLTHTGTY